MTIDVVIFGFGLIVTVIVGFGLTTMIVTHNRAIARAQAESKSQFESDS